MLYLLGSPNSLFYIGLLMMFTAIAGSIYYYFFPVDNWFKEECQKPKKKDRNKMSIKINSDKYVTFKWFIWTVGGISAAALLILGFIFSHVFNMIETGDSNCKNEIKNMVDKYQSDHDKIMKFEELKPIIQNDHDSLIKLEKRLENLKK